MPVWLEKEAKLRKAPPSHPAVRKFIERVSYFGQVAEIDSQGRLLIQPRLRESARINGPVAVLGNLDHLVLWNDENIGARVKSPLTTEDEVALSGFEL